jgi:hypothetical protein
MLNGLDFSNKNLKMALELTINEQINHNELANWCYRYVNDVYFNDIEISSLDVIGKKLILDIDAQWELYLSNNYILSELQTIDYHTVKMPIEWLHKWYNAI